MASLSLLIFDLDGARFGLDATRVRESVWLPELTAVEEAPPWIVGLFDLRGRIVPVADLRLRFHHPARRYTSADQVIVLETEHEPMGLIVSEVIEVIELPGEAVQPPPHFDAPAPGHAHLVIGEARVGDELVTVLDAIQLAQLSQPPLPSPPPLAGEGVEVPSPARSALKDSDPLRAEALVESYAEEGWGGGATPEERALFRKRAMKLREGAPGEDGARLGLAVVELGGEYFGVELSAVQEFRDIVQLSPIPCCPPHILGAISLRGNLLTLIDPRAALNLPPAAMGGKAVVGRLGEQAVGIAVDEVHDVVYLPREKLQGPPPVLRERCGAEIMGTAPYGGRTMTVLDLPALLAREEWIVDENV